MWFVKLSDPLARDSQIVGGKAANLARLYAGGFPVPTTIIVTTAAFETFFADCAEPGAAERGREPSRWGAFTQQVQRELDELHRSAHPGAGAHAGYCFAVRSSAVGEDTNQASHAGIFSSYLHVKREDVPGCIVQCWQSTQTEVARRYAHGGLAAGLKMAVIIQPMIPVQISGVGFTANPLTFDDSRLYIEVQMANAPPAPAELAAARPPTVETILVERSNRRRVPADDAPAAERSASRHIIRPLVELLVAVETHFQTPMDIEWAWDGDALWVLQARAITRPYASAPGHNIVWSNTNLKETLPDLPSPATWSAISSCLTWAFKRLFSQFGYEWPAGEPVVSDFWGRGYVNISRVCDATGYLFGIAPETIIASLGGQSIPVAALHRASSSSVLRQWVNTGRFFRTCDRVANRTGDSYAAARAWRDHALARLAQPVSPAELRELIVDLQTKASEFMYEYLLLLFGAIGTHHFLQKLIADRTDFDSQSVGRLLAGIGAVPGADLVQKILDAAALVQRDGALLETFPQTDWGQWETEWAGTPFGAALNEFLDDFGHRTTGASELEMAHPRWNEDPGQLLELIHHAATAPPRQRPIDGQHQARRNAEEALFNSAPIGWRLPLRLLVAQSQRFARLRETGKHHLLFVIEAGRQMLLRAGTLFVEAQWIEAPADVFFLTLPDILDGLAGKGAGLAAKIEIARSRLKQFEVIQPPDTFSGARPHSVVHRRDDHQGLSGVGSSPGRVTAPARVLNHPHEIDRLNPGDILVCRTIDTSWLPLFFTVSGIVVEVGGFLSHCSIIARELGIPTVVNVPHAMSAIKDGCMIAVDGELGQVHYTSGGMVSRT